MNTNAVQNRCTHKYILLLFSLLDHEDSLGYNSLTSVMNCSDICDLLNTKLENLEMLNQLIFKHF